jgi:hypothetical protein
MQEDEGQEEELYPPIYAAPTTDTLGDESVLIRPYAVQTPTRYRRPLSTSGRSRNVISIASSRTTTPVVERYSVSGFARASTASTTVIANTTAPQPRRRRPKRHPGNEFQHVEDFMRVSVQTVNIAQRSAFETVHPPPPHSSRRVSPSNRHLEILRKLLSVTLVRQVQFSPSTGMDSDCLFLKEQQQRESPGDGRYRSIHPVHATVAALPSPAPVLSHKKIRQPMRSDVGFPNATPEENQIKHNEIRHETAWEEASPRLVVLVTSDDLGTAVNENDDDNSIPVYAGRELLQAIERNARHFGKNDGPSIAIHPNPYSMLAPPLDASYSPSQGWRPRPFHDRPAGLSYFLACPLQVTINQEQEDVQALVGSLALYTFGDNNDPVGNKVSEEFYFPSGDWTGANVHVDATRRAGKMDPELVALWLDRKQKAIFSYDPLELRRESLYIVLRIYKIMHVGVSQLLSPVSFGITEAYPPDAAELQWPHGKTIEMKLYTHETHELQESFVERLVALVHPKGSAPTAGLSEEQEDVASTNGTMTTSEGTKKRSVVGRLFRSSTKDSKPRALPANRPPLAIGRCVFFLSSLSVDFLQSMLASPVELRESGESKQRLPRLLVDVSGDFAVVMEEDQTQHILPHPADSVKKRSSLLRLPPSTQPAGYIASSEFREVLHLPARADKHYEFDSALSYRSLQNLLYLYPRLIRLSSDSDNGKLPSLTVRVRVIHSDDGGESGDAKTSWTVMKSFHSPTPWSSGNLVNEVFTAITGAQGGDSKSGLPLNDEFKLRLPLLLDGTFSLLISLFEVFDSSSRTDLRLLAEASVPLSSSAPRDGKSGGRVATVIPNGNHRLKLGHYQLQLETRLVSSIHIGDPSVAMLIRDFPQGNHENQGMESIQLVDSTSSNSLKLDFFSNNSPLSSASGSSVLCHFHALMYLHLWNLVNAGDHSGTNSLPAFLTGNVRSMFEVLSKTKSRLQSSASSGKAREATQAFLKKFMDAFDEACLSQSSRWSDQTGEVSIDSEFTDKELETSASQDEPSDAQDESPDHDGGAVRIRKKSSSHSQSDMRVTRIRRALGPSDVPFSRVAYGATKTDRMRLEAELHYETDHHAPFFDDDETVATAPSIYTKTDVPNISMPRKVPNFRDDASHNSILKSSIAGTSTGGSARYRHSSIGNTEFASRVKTAAQVMLAPCVGPSFLAGKSSPRRHPPEPEVKTEKKDVKPASSPPVKVS